MSTIPDYPVLSDIEKVRALRRYVYRRAPLASTQASLNEISDGSLAEAFAGLEGRKKGVWCGGAAILLSRLYQAAGFDSWIYDFGRANMLTHITTLVRVRGEIYLQDGYLDFEQDDASGAPVDFFRALADTRRRHPPQTRALVEPRVGYYPDQMTADVWAGRDASRDCKPVGEGLRCVFPVSLPHFLDIFFLMPQTYDFLTSEGWPPDIAYLLLYPSRLLSVGAHGQAEAVTLMGRAQALQGAAPQRERSSPAASFPLVLDDLAEMLSGVALLGGGLFLWRRRAGAAVVLPLFDAPSTSARLGTEEVRKSQVMFEASRCPVSDRSGYEGS